MAKGLFDELGIGAADEQALLEQGRQQVGSRLFNQQRMLGQQASPLVRGVAAAAGGLVSGENDGRSFRGVGQNFVRGGQAQQDKMAADAGGITVEQLRARREIRKLSSNFVDDGNFDKRIATLKQIAATANKHGDLQTMAAALRKVTEVEAEKLEHEKAGLTNADTKRTQDMEKEIGLEAELLGGGKGKAVRINEGVDTGKYLFIEAGKPDQIVRGGDLKIAGVTNPEARALTAGERNRETVEYWAAKNGATSGQIAKMRANMNSMSENTQIVANIADNLLAANDPQGILSVAGKAAIAADKSVSFVESVSSTLADPRAPESPITWNGKKTTAKGQRAQFVNSAKKEGALLGMLNSIAGEKGLAEFADLNDFLPPNIRGNALAAEQYWANVMELAYLDARLMEPSNRGLSDNDVKMALKRIGADTANPESFATRQIQVIDTKLLPAIDNLGSDFSVPADIESVDATDVANFVYTRERRQAIRDTLLMARQKLIDVMEQGRRGENREVPDPTNEFEPDKTLDQLKQELAELEAGEV